MKIQIIYFHRLHFPSSSGQTIQVIRDYFGMATQHNVHLFYRAHQALKPEEVNNLLREHNAKSCETFKLHHIGEETWAKYKFRAKLVSLIKDKSQRTLLVTRTIDHANYALKLASKHKHICAVLELHETAIPHLIYQQQKRPLRTLLSKIQERNIFLNIDGLIATAPPQIELLGRLYKNHAPIILLPNSCAPDIYTTKNKNTDLSFKIRYAGQFSGWKNTDILFEALKNLPHHFILELAGGKRGREKDTQQLIEEKTQQCGVSGRVFYKGVLAPVDVPKFLAEGDSLVLPLGNNLQSHLFTSPMKLFEYAASGTPMVVTDQPTTRSLIEDGQEALFVAPNDAPGLAKAIEALAADQGLAHTMAAKARKWVEQFSVYNRVAKYNQFIDRIMQPGSINGPKRCTVTE